MYALRMHACACIVSTFASIEQRESTVTLNFDLMTPRFEAFICVPWCIVMPNTHRRRDETRQFCLVGVGGVYWALFVSFGEKSFTHFSKTSGLTDERTNRQHCVGCQLVDTANRFTKVTTTTWTTEIEKNSRRVPPPPVARNDAHRPHFRPPLTCHCSWWQDAN